MPVKNLWLNLYNDAVSKRQHIDARIARRNELYKGTNKVRDRSKGDYSTKAAYTYRNMCFELIETQINNAIPQPKVTPRDIENMDLALELEGYLKMEMDRLQSETMNDEVERGVLKQGTHFYMVGWDETKTTPTTRGELFVKQYPLQQVYPQPGVKNIQDAEYIFTKDLVSIAKLKQLYGVKVPSGAEFEGLNTLITAWYYNQDGYVSRYGWVENSDIVVFDDEGYELRQIQVCKKCDEPRLEETVCKVCGHNKFKYITQEFEAITEDILKGDPTKEQAPTVLVKKDTPFPFYKIRQLPFVMRVNISDDNSLYGVSDIDLLENTQESLNKLFTKMEENVLKAGSLVIAPKGVHIPTTDETLKIVKVNTAGVNGKVEVVTLQANMQQDEILAERMYQVGRAALGITDSYQGKRDPTAESGKAKEISAAQASGRLESKRRMKDAAYADLYQLMFKFLLAYCDDKRPYAKTGVDGTVTSGTFYRYNYLDGVSEAVYYNDRFLFGVDTASILSTSRESMWRETTANFQSGTFGNPADPNALILYWTVMKELGYPLAKACLSSLQQRNQQLPFEMQQAIMQNPEILQAVQQQLTGGENVQNNKQ